ncbi:MAG TPA: hypothetical protein VJ846_02810, partial [Sphingomicrobium sp.]|nr:hypothetical protein [Sphingomicrobium sp.]
IGSAGWAFLTIVRGISVGQIKRWPRGLLNYQRDVDPIAFWAIVKANALAGLMCLLAALGAYAFI